MGNRVLQPNEEAIIVQMVKEGHTQRAICETLGRNKQTVYNFIQRVGLAQREKIRNEDLQGPIPRDRLGAAAIRGLEDFEFFRLHFFGHITRPWHSEAAVKIKEYLESPDREYVVLNAPSGCGKSTFKVDLAAWLTCHNRGIRGLFGSDTQNNANRDLRRLRRMFERTTPMKATDYELRWELACDAKTTLSLAYGRFKPIFQETWREDGFVVEQAGEDLISEKEPTWSSYGRDSGQLGNRFNIVFWDDLVTKKNTQTVEGRDKLRHDWDTEFESRLEPGGMHVLIGQRMAPDDLYRYCLDKLTEELGADEDGNEIVLATRPKYHHIAYKAHYEERCLYGAKGSHLRDALPWKRENDGYGGCLLDPGRLPWVDLRGIMGNNPNAYAMLYQQEDGHLDDALVLESWIEGTTDDEGTHIGCLDRDRGLREMPKGLRGPLWSIATIDPSASNWWGVAWWIVAQPADLRFLFDIFNERVQAPRLLDWDNDAQAHVGLMEEWQQASLELGFPITHWIVEENACQKWLYQYEHFKRWQTKWRVNVLPHSTGHRKLDSKLGVPMLGPLYKFGKYRLPWAKPAQPKVRKLVTQLTRWSGERKMVDDLVMSNWFLEVKLPQIMGALHAEEPVYLDRPSWLGGGPRWEPERAQGAESPYERWLRERRAGVA